MAPINPSQMLPIGYTLAGRYRIERYISSGGFGNTYLALDINLDAKVAVKEFFMRGDTHRASDGTTVSVSNPSKEMLFKEQLRKFNTEAKRIRSLHSEHIIRVSDLLQANNTSYYIMDFIEGESLASRLKRTGSPLTEQETWQMLYQMLDALETVHQAGLFHLDIKPANIMFTTGKAVLIDFGASKQISSSGEGATNSTALCYTPGYAPTEQIDQQSDKIGAWTDIYALGATLYKLVTNERPPLPSDITDEGAGAFHFPPHLSQAMRTLIVRMMHPVRSQRPPSIAALRELIGGLSTSASPYTASVHHLAHSNPTGERAAPSPTMTQVQAEGTTITKPSSNRISSITWLTGLLLLIAEVVFAIVIRIVLGRKGPMDIDGIKLLSGFIGATIAILISIFMRHPIITRFWNVIKWVATVGCFANSLLIPIWNHSLTDTYLGLSICLALISSVMFVMPKDKNH